MMGKSIRIFLMASVLLSFPVSVWAQEEKEKEWNELIARIEKPSSQVKNAEAYAEAIEVARKALEFALSNFDPDHHSVAVSQRKLADLHSAQALEYYRKAQKINERILVSFNTIDFGWKASALVVLSLFPPLIAFSYYRYRYKYKAEEMKNLIKIVETISLGEHEICKENKKSKENCLDKKDEGNPPSSLYPLLCNYVLKGGHFILPVLLSTLIAMLGLAVLFFGNESGIYERHNLLLAGTHLAEANVVPYQQQALLVLGMAFLGAYLWGLQTLFRRFVLNDLLPGTFYSFFIRMIFASIIALLVYHGIEAIVDGNEQISGSVMPLMAFFVGMFPQRGLNWLTRRLRFQSYETDPSVRELPLEMIEGMTIHDKLRLQEQGIDTCYDLALADFIPLLLKTPYSARELIDWLLQAKLCVKFGPAVKDLRERGIRTIKDIYTLEENEIGEMAQQTTLTENSLLRAKKELAHDKDIPRLWEAYQLLSRYCGPRNQAEEG
jgi:hypothetical protein